MFGIVRLFVVALLLCWPLVGRAVGLDEAPASVNSEVVETVQQLQEPLYSPFVERYILDDLRSLREQMAQQRHELQQQILDREHSSVDRAVAYATDTVTYFFYLVAAASSILVIVGWTSIRDIKERVHSLADSEISKLIDEYENRLQLLEKQLRAKSIDIEDNREEIENAKEIQSLWLRAQQELNPTSKISTYDQILAINPDDIEALTYKADAVLELNEPLWAINLCNLALAKDAENAHAHYQLGCAYTQLEHYEDAINCLLEAVHLNASYRNEIYSDDLLAPLRELPTFEARLEPNINI